MSIKSTLGSLVRNRKVLFLLFVGLFFTVSVHTLHGQGITVQYKEILPHNQVLTYAPISQTIADNYLVTDVQIRKCMKGFSCLAPKPSSSKSTWHKIDTKLNLHEISFSSYNYYMYVEKTHGPDASVFVTDVQFNPSDKAPNDKNKWKKHKVTSNLYVWINYMEQPDFETPYIRDVNLLFGTHDMKDTREHWKFNPAPIALPMKQSVQPHASLLAISVNDEMPIINSATEFESILKKNSLITTREPKFKIAQLSDLHIGLDQGRCFGEECKFDSGTLDFISLALESEGDIKLVVITGDLIDIERVKHIDSAVLKALSPILALKIPFVFTFGDSDWDWNNYHTKINILNFVSSLPNCYNKDVSQADHRMHGLTNYNIKVYREPPASDDNKYDYNKLDLGNPDAIVTVLDSEFAEVDATQSNFMYRVTLHLSPDMNHRLLFFHYPLPNFRPDKQFKLIGSYNEKHKLETPTDRKFLIDAIDCGYKAISVGHEHENDACIWKTELNKDVLLCYSGIAGESGITKLEKDFSRRFRIFQIDFDNNNILSWKRTAKEPFDPQAIWPLGQ